MSPVRRARGEATSERGDRPGLPATGVAIPARGPLQRTACPPERGRREFQLGEAGITRLILAGVIETPSDRRAYESALDMPLTVVRLRGDLDVIRDRLVRRHSDNLSALRWHLERAPHFTRFHRCRPTATDVDSTSAREVSLSEWPLRSTPSARTSFPRLASRERRSGSTGTGWAG